MPGLALLCDDVYDMLYYDGKAPPPPIACLDHYLGNNDAVANLDKPWSGDYFPEDGQGRKGGVISMGTFSKIVAPGLRLGWMHTQKTLIDDYFMSRGYVSSGGGLNPFTSGIVKVMIDDANRDGSFAACEGSDVSVSLSSHVRELCRVYGHRAKVLTAELARLFPTATILPKGSDGKSDGEGLGGYFVWMKLGQSDVDKYNRNTFLTSCRNRGVNVLSGPACAAPVDGQSPFLHCYRLCFAHYDGDSLIEGARRLRLALDDSY